MRILFIVPYTPSLIRVRSAQLIRQLARRGHEMAVVFLSSSKKELDDVNSLIEEKVDLYSCSLPKWRPLWNCIIRVPTRTPFQAAFPFEPRLLDQVEQLLNESMFDIVHVEHLRGSIYGLKVRQMLTRRQYAAGAKNRTPVVWDSVDCISHLFQQASVKSRSVKGRLMARMDLARTRRFEGWLTTQFDHLLVSSAVDQEALEQLRLEFQFSGKQGRLSANERCGMTVLPNGVDLTYFAPSNSPREEATLVFSGKMSYHANVTTVHHLAREIMPRVWSRRADVKLMVVGKDPPRSVLSLASRCRSTDVKSVNHGNSVCGTVEVTGEVPDIRPYLRRATLAVVPLVYGAGSQLKVLEAMACGTPVVASPRAISPLAVREGIDILVRGDNEGFAQAILELLGDRERRVRVGQAGRNYVKTHHDWNTLGAALEETYEQVIGSTNEGDFRMPLRSATAAESRGVLTHPT